MITSRPASRAIVRALVSLSLVLVLGVSPMLAMDRGGRVPGFSERLQDFVERLRGRDAEPGRGGQTGGDVPDPGVADVDLLALADEVSPTPVEGVREGIALLRDADGIPHVFAYNREDLFFGQGWAHASDRLFQMDILRRQASGTLAELFGPAALGSDVELRTIGLRRAAVKSWEALSEETRTDLAAYAAGVNAWVASHPLPLEYTLLETSRFEPWTTLDSLAVAKLIAFSLSFNLDIGPTQNLLTYIAVGQAAGFDGQVAYFEDCYRAEPFGDRTTLGDSGTPLPYVELPDDGEAASLDLPYTKGTAALLAGYLERAREVPLLSSVLEGHDAPRGSNLWAVSGALSESGRAMIANDPHLALNTPTTFYQIGLHVPRLDVEAVGSSFPGVSYLVQGQNRHIAWGSTVNPIDETDVFQEQVVPDESSPSGLSTLYLGAMEPVVPVPELYVYNVLDGVFDNPEIAEPNGMVGEVFVPAATLIVPRRMDGPILALDEDTGEAISLQYTGFGPTRELDAFRIWSEAKSVEEFRAGLDVFDVGSQNWVVADVGGNIGYFTSAELPIREDLQAGSIEGSPPSFVRNGQGGNEWAPVTNPQPGQATPHEVLPFEEMPQTVNPPAGWFVNANNDPAGMTLDNNPFDQLRAGGGLYYIQNGYSIGNRAERVTARLVEAAGDGSVSVEEMTSIQADVVLFDALVFRPYLVAAYDAAGEVGADPALVAVAEDPRVVEAIERLAAWDGSTPTGVPEGYDASDIDGVRLEPTQEEIGASVAATIYSVWRGQVIANTIDSTLDALQLPRPGGSQALTALRTLLERYPLLGGSGASGLDFFDVEGVDDPAAERDVILLQSLVDALDLLAGDAFAPAFGGSADQNDYRWGRLHRIVLDHPLGGPFDVPPAAGLVPPSFEDLPGLAVDGGFDVPDASSHDPRAADARSFMFGSGPVRRYVGVMGDRPGRSVGKTSLPGGSSGQAGNPWSVNLLAPWLTNETYPVRQTTTDVVNALSGGEVLIPADPGFEPPIQVAPRVLERLGSRGRR